MHDEMSCGTASHDVPTTTTGSISAASERMAVRYGTCAPYGHRRACARGARAPALTTGHTSSTMSYSVANAVLTSRHWPLGERARPTCRRVGWHTRARAWTTRVRDVARDGVSTSRACREDRSVKERVAGALGRASSGAGSEHRQVAPWQLVPQSKAKINQSRRRCRPPHVIPGSTVSAACHGVPNPFAKWPALSTARLQWRRCSCGGA